MSKKMIRIIMSLVLAFMTVNTVLASEGVGIKTELSEYIMYFICGILLVVVIIQAIGLHREKNKIADIIEKTDEELKKIAEEEQLLNEIEEGLNNNEFKMHLQFIVDNKSKKIVSAEGLSRWEKPNGELIFPGKFIPVMEKYGIISKLDYCMFEEACKKLAAWKGTEFDDFTISCNFTRITISEKDFISKIKAISERYDFDRSKLLIEITEDAIEKNINVAMDNIFKSKEMGFVIALDDIGSGYTSLLNLCEYPLDTVKLDRKMLLKTDETKGKDLFMGVISLVHKLKLKIVCEGVETDEQNELVTDSDCDYIQGWYYSRALPEKEAEEFARNYMKAFEKGE